MIVGDGKVDREGIIYFWPSRMVCFAFVLPWCSFTLLLIASLLKLQLSNGKSRS